MFKPTYIFDGIEEIELEFLKREKINFLIMDLDNTIIDSKINIPKKKKAWLDNVQKNGIKICILSNSSNQAKVSSIAKLLDVPYLLNGCKPAKKGYELALKMLDADRKNAVQIGDQLFTDIWGANRVKMRSILVKPFDKKEPLWVIAKRPIEKIVLKCIKSVDIINMTRKKNKK